MKSRFVLALAVFAGAFLERASAVSITQVASFPISGNAQSSISTGPTWPVQAFNVPGATLESVQFTYTINAFISGGLVNHAAVPQQLSASVNLKSTASMGTGGMPFFGTFPGQSSTITGPLTLVQPNQAANASGNVTQTETVILTAPSLLANFYPPFTPTVYMQIGATASDGVTLNGTVDLTLTYVYNSVPDGGATWMLLGLAAPALFLLRGKRAGMTY